MPEIRTSAPYNYNQSPNPDQKSPAEPQASDNNQDEAKDQETQSRLEKARKIVSTVSLFLAAPLFALILILFVIQSYEVDGPSMQDTLHDKDLLIVNKMPKTWSRITRHAYIPARGEIIIFTKDESLGFGGGQSRQLVKRVVGLPGERVTVKDGTVTVYNRENPDGFKPDENPAYNQTAKIEYTQGDIDLTVPEDHIFVMGDNRNNSLDSRSFGPISSDEIVGSLGIRLFPLNQARKF